MASSPSLAVLLTELERALAYTDLPWTDLSADEVAWRPNEESSAIGWHLGHQAAVAHFMVRNLTAAESSPDPELDSLMDSATPERQRGELPPVDRLAEYRRAVADRVRFRLGAIERGEVSAPSQLRLVAATLLVAVVNHEYQHDKWIGEVRDEQLGYSLPPAPTSPYLAVVDGYTVITV